MKISKKQLFLLFFVNLGIYCQKTPVAIYFNLVYQNDDSGNIVGNLASTSALFAVLREKFGYFKATYIFGQMLRYKSTMKEMGEEIGKTMTGIGNVTRELMNRVRNELSLDLPDEAHRPLTELGISPVSSLENIELIRKLKNQRPTIGLSAEDPLSFEIYQQKMNIKYNIEVSELFDEIVINPALYDKEIVEKRNTTNIIISGNLSHSDSLSLAIQAATKHIFKQKHKTPIIKTYEQLQQFASQ